METAHNDITLPPYDARIKIVEGRSMIFDTLRRKYVRLTPEEWVRQHFVHFLIIHKGFPSALIANEVKLKVGNKVLRADTVLYDTLFHPRMIIEYKSPDVAIGQAVFNQIAVYNMILHVDYLIVSNGINHYICKMDYNGVPTYSFLRDIPNYNDL